MAVSEIDVYLENKNKRKLIIICFEKKKTKKNTNI